MATRLLVLASLLLLACALPATAAPKSDITVVKPIPGPFGANPNLVYGDATVRLTFTSKEQDAPLEFAGVPISAILVAGAQPIKVAGHPFELFVVVAPKGADGKPDVQHAYVRCGTVTQDAAHQVPGEKISATTPSRTPKGSTPRTTYSVASAPKVAVGYIDYPALAKLAGVVDAVKKPIVATDFTISLADKGAIRFYTEAPFQTGTLSIVVDVPTWQYDQ